ncbi:MAG TPA: outer membrane beta-barrel protein [Bryobacteraceae bacterium]|nr:outer membrane beta-barrel protein [Bryobacteraceae bacterium]
MKNMLRAACLLTLGAVGLPAQTASVVRSGSYEVGGFVGASYGIDDFRWMGGANVTYAVNKYILPYAEFSYFPGIGRKQTRTIPGLSQPINISYNIPLSDFHGGVHIRMPIREFPIVPYGVFGAGMIHAPERQFNVDVEGIPVAFTSAASTDAAINFGGGLRYYINQRFGIRAEAKAYKPTGQFKETFGKVEFGFFIQLR